MEHAVLAWGKAQRKEWKERNTLKKLFHKHRQINTNTDTLLATKKSYTAKTVHLSATVYSDSSAVGLGHT